MLSDLCRFTERCVVEADIELGSIDLLIEFAKLGFGVAFVSRSYAAKELTEGTLHELKPAKAIPNRSIGIATRREMTLSFAAAKFLEKLSSDNLPSLTLT